MTVETSSGSIPESGQGAAEAAPVERTSWLGAISARMMWLEAGLLLVFAHVLLAGYQMGAGNQTIQIPFIKRLLDASLYKGDAAVDTIRDYPSYFFAALAFVVKYVGLSPTYLILHIATALAVLGFVYLLSRTLFRDYLAAGLAILFLFAGQHDALGGDALYSLGFTHTWAVFPMAIAAFILLYRDHQYAAFVLAGLIFNLHALMGAYLFAMLTFWAILQNPRSVRRAVLRVMRIVPRAIRRIVPLPASAPRDEAKPLGVLRIGLMLLLFFAAASPTLAQMAKHGQKFDEEWVRLTRIRSAEHSFPSSWWQAGRTDIPRFLMITAIAALSLSFPAAPRQQRKTLLLAGGCIMLFVIGYVFAELLPLKAGLRAAVLRAQLFRSSRLLMVLMFVQIAYAAACGLRQIGGESRLPIVGRLLEVISAAVVVLCLSLPPLMQFLPFAVVLLTVAALISGRLSAFQAVLSCISLWVALAASRDIGFAIPFVSERFSWHGLHGWPALSREEMLLCCISLAGGIGIWLVSRLSPGPSLRALIVLQGVGVCALLGVASYRCLVTNRLAKDDWVQAQIWASRNTAPQKSFLVPVQRNLSGFRVHSNRPVVCEWRDGTQMYFTAGFAAKWWDRVKTLRPNTMFDDSGRELSPGTPLQELPDREIYRLAKMDGADYIVLPSTKEDRSFKRVYKNNSWTIYEALAEAPPDAVDKNTWFAQERFMDEVVLPNIEKYRKSPATLKIVDASGQSVSALEYDVRQIRHAFGFGCSLPFFAPRTPDSRQRDYCPPPVTPKELERFLEIFNYSVIPFSAKWMYLEPAEGKHDFSELDKYVDFCEKNEIEMEFHYLSGLYPTWLYTKRDSALQGRAFQRHARECIQRYGTRIRTWQVVNDRYQLSYSPAIFEELKKINPNCRLGISDCTKFYSSGMRGSSDLFRGLPDVSMLKAQKVPIDFFAPHGHAPFGLWADVRTMYQVFDAFAKEGVKVHVTEELIPCHPGAEIVGPVRCGQWTEELKADFIERFFTVCFSHPAVDVCNYWSIGPASSHAGSGLLDENYEPTPAFNRLKHLIKEKWMTRASGRLAPDGRIDFPNGKAFHGDYEVTVKLSSDRVAKGKFSIQPDKPNTITLRLDEQAGTLR